MVLPALLESSFCRPTLLSSTHLTLPCLAHFLYLFCLHTMESLIPPWPFRSVSLLFTFLVSWLSSNCDGACDQPFTCGFYSFAYPFGKENNGCGDPALQLECDLHLGTFLINISGHQYYILQPEFFSLSNYTQTMTIVDTRVKENACDLSSTNNTAEFWLNPQFHISNGYTNATLGKQCAQEKLPNSVLKFQCSDDLYYIPISNLSSIRGICKSYVQLPVRIDPKLPRYTSPDDIIQEGFEIEWNLSADCQDCKSRNGTCAYNVTTMVPFCQPTAAVPYNHRTSSNRGTITGIATGTGALITIVALFLVVFYRKRLSSSKEIPTSVSTELMNSGSVGRVENFLQSYIHQMPTRYSFSQLKKITNNFADKLGEGGFGVVYKGKLRSGFLVAVKLLDQSRQSEKQFMNEVATLGTIHHVHLVRLMGYCFESFRSALVYEYMANGSLENFIFQGKEEEQKLGWDQLYSIALGAARGIVYLHEDCSRRIIHFDIKPHNILLDENFTPKVADFGLAKICGKAEEHVSMTGGRGTAGYAAPEVRSRNWGPVTEKSDVYSFGMLLLEIAGRRRNIELQVSRSSQLYFPTWAFKLIEIGEFEKNLRVRSRGDMAVEDEEKVRRLAKVGLWCIQLNSVDRPSMNRVLQMLEGNGDDVSNPPLPFNSSSSPRDATLSSSFEESSSMLQHRLP